MTTKISNDQKYIINTSKEEVYQTMLLMLNEIILKGEDEFELFEDINDILPEFYDLIKDHDKLISDKADEVFLSLQTYEKYENLVRCFRFYYSNCIKSDIECSQSFKDIKEWILNNNLIYDLFEFDKELLIQSLDITIDFLDDVNDEFDISCLITLTLLLFILPDKLRLKYNDASQYIRFILV